MSHANATRAVLCVGLCFMIGAMGMANLVAAKSPPVKPDDSQPQINPKAKAGDPRAPQKAQLKKSLATWQKARKTCGGNYKYEVRYRSFVGFGHVTTIVVRDNKVAERHYREFNYSRATLRPVPAAPIAPGKPGKGEAKVVKPKPAPPQVAWVEKGKEIGKHKKGAAPLTLDQLYKKAADTLDVKVDPKVHRFFVYFDKQGLLQSCFYVHTLIADDAPRHGVIISNLTLGKPTANRKDGKGDKGKGKAVEGKKQNSTSP